MCVCVALLHVSDSVCVCVCVCVCVQAERLEALVEQYKARAVALQQAVRGFLARRRKVRMLRDQERQRQLAGDFLARITKSNEHSRAHLHTLTEQVRV